MTFRPSFPLRLFVGLLVALLGLGTIQAAHAATHTTATHNGIYARARDAVANDVWTDASHDHRWSDATNWSLSVVPGPNDVAVFSGQGTNDDVTIDVVAQINELQIPDYLGTITVQSNLTISGCWCQSSGTVNVLGSQAVAVGGDWSVSGPGATFNSGQGTVAISGLGSHYLDSGYQNFNNLTLSDAIQLLHTPLRVAGTLQSNGTLDTNHENVSAGALQLSSGSLVTTINTSITVSGAATLSGEALSVSNTGVPSGEIFPVLTAGTLSGTFATTTFSGTVSYQANTVVLTAAVTGIDLALTNVPTDVTAVATSPSGAVVTYASPTVNDDSGQGGVVNCVPASDSTFAIGMTTVTCTATDSDDTPGTVSGSFSVIVQPVLTVSGANVNPTEGSAFSGVVATGIAYGTTNPLSASIVWGDGSNSTGSITLNPDGSYSVSGSHTYAEEGPFALTVTVTDSGSLSAKGSGSAKVADAALTLTHFVAGPLGHRLAGVAATFTDADPAGQVSDYTATITWGDGTTSTVKVITNPPGKGFVLAGLHSYARTGTYTVTLTLTDTGGSQLTKTVTVSVK